MQSKLLSLIFVLSAFCLQAQQTKKALFIGNSYTAFNNLPQLVHDVALSVGDTLIYDAHTPGGQTLEAHSTNATALNKINADDWDYVSLQEQSQRPAFPIAQVQQQVFPFAASLCNSIRDNNNCTRPIFYMTWGRENGDAQNCPTWPPVCTYEGMDSLLNLRYSIMANDNDTYLSPVGAVWHYIRDNYPDIDLYANDGSHPSAAGSYAAACSFYTVIFQKDPTNISFDFTLSADEASQIREAAHSVVFENMATYNVGIFNPLAGFTFDVVASEVSFTNTSQMAVAYQWNFGDGNTSTEENPIHTYSAANNYQVVLSATDGCGLISHDTMLVQIDITDAVNEKKQAALRLFPNPATDFLVLENVANQVAFTKILSLDGKVLKREVFQSKVDISALPKGVYNLLILNAGDEVLQQGRFVVE